MRRSEAVFGEIRRLPLMLSLGPYVRRMSADVAFGGVHHGALSGTSALVVSRAVSGLVGGSAHDVVMVRGLRGAPPACFRRLTTWWEAAPSNVPRLIGQSVQDLGAASIE